MRLFSVNDVSWKFLAEVHAVPPTWSVSCLLVYPWIAQCYQLHWRDFEVVICNLLTLFLTFYRLTGLSNINSGTIDSITFLQQNAGTPNWRPEPICQPNCQEKGYVDADLVCWEIYLSFPNGSDSERNKTYAPIWLICMYRSSWDKSVFYPILLRKSLFIPSSSTSQDIYYQNRRTVRKSLQ